MKYVKSPNVVVYWSGNRLTLEEFVARRRVFAEPIVVELLNKFRRPRDRRAVERAFGGYSPTSVRRTVGQLLKAGLLLPATARGRRIGTSSPAAAWPGGISAAYYHFANRDPAYARTGPEYLRFLIERLREAPQPNLFKRYSGSRRIGLSDNGQEPAGMALGEALRKRRTVRGFHPRSIPFSKFARLIRWTWGQTRWLDSGILGRLVAKTSPSAGARHPVECYVLVWRVSQVSPGLYHYNVQSDCLERLRRGDFRSEILRFVAGCDWIRNAAFLCVMTAVAGRLYWKYPSAGAYRLFFLDAGHLAQTFALLSTALGLGAFTTAAFQHSRIEKLLRLDGTSEFPLYLCGAGVPDPALSAQDFRPVQHDAQRSQRPLPGRHH